MVGVKSCLFLLLLQIAGYLLFLKGFFPPKVVLQDVASFRDEGSPFEVDGKPQFDRLVVMVVDAMRSDFMYSLNDSSMEFLHSLIENGSALPFTSYSNPPTVTLPRLKGITTGGTPSFIDAILNVADENDNSQSLANSDSWLRQFKSLQGGRVIHFYGDDTWLKLFPPADFFESYEGTSSFFVSDYTEVDHNVTRHLENVLRNDTWDALILHYLGMDHIGHKGGPQSPFMKPKQIEMDNIVREIYFSSVQSSPSTLMVLMGDHGMNEVGNHGGSSRGETSPGMVLISPKLKNVSKGAPCPVPVRPDFDYYSMISQIDIVPTLAALFNFPIPRNNLGVVIPEVLGLWDTGSARKNVLLENCEQFLGLLREKYSPTDAKLGSIIEEFHQSRDNDFDLQDILRLLKKYQSILTASATSYSYGEITLGCVIILISLAFSCYQLYQTLYVETQSSTFEKAMLIIICLAFGFHYHGSSLIEEEHQIWWFILISLLLTLFSGQGSWGKMHAWIILLCLRIIKGWNDSGQKFTSPVTIVTYLSNSGSVLWALVASTYFIVTWLLISEGDWIKCFSFSRLSSWKPYSFLTGFVVFVVTNSVSMTSFVFKVSQYLTDGNRIPWWLKFIDTSISELLGTGVSDDKLLNQLFNVQLSRLFAASILMFIFARILMGRVRRVNDSLVTDLLNLATIFLMHQSRVEVIPIFLVFTALRFTYRELENGHPQASPRLSLVWMTLLILCIQNLSFFSVGNTNLLATIDLSNAYNGVPSYDIVQVAFLTFISNFAMPLYWSFAGLQILTEGGMSDGSTAIDGPSSSKVPLLRKAVMIKSSFTLFFYGSSMINLTLSCINLRYHLFIWSVFCPKLLYFLSWSVLINFGVDFTLGLLIASLK